MVLFTGVKVNIANFINRYKCGLDWSSYCDDLPGRFTRIESESSRRERGIIRNIDIGYLRKRAGKRVLTARSPRAMSASNDTREDHRSSRGATSESSKRLLSYVAKAHFSRQRTFENLKQLEIAFYDRRSSYIYFRDWEIQSSSSSRLRRNIDRPVNRYEPAARRAQSRRVIDILVSVPSCKTWWLLSASACNVGTIVYRFFLWYLGE